MEPEEKVKDPGQNPTGSKNTQFCNYLKNKGFKVVLGGLQTHSPKNAELAPVP